MPRTGVFVCHCGTNIAKTVDCAAVAERARELPGVVYAADYTYMCSAPGQDLVAEAIREHRLDSVVVASCSPRLHEPTFQRCVAGAGLNPYLMEMANLREQVSWVHSDQPVATEKACDLVRAAVAKAQRNAPLERQKLPVTKRALVIGGGIAGIQAALDIAETGSEVVLVEKSPSIGGRMAQFDKTFPTLDCAACILTPKMVEAASHPLIRLLTWSQVEKVEGFVGSFEVTLRRRARYVEEEACVGCGECWVKCPVQGIPSEFDAELGTRTAIYRPFPQAIPNVPVIDKQRCLYLTRGRCGACAQACPKQCIDYTQEDRLEPVQVGAIVVATGFEVEPGKLYGEYGYGEHPDLITGMQLERMINVSGPTGGHLVRPSTFDPKTGEGQAPQTVVFIQCCGSRDPEKGVAYCSKVCCMYSAKQALLVREKLPHAQVYLFYMDLRAAGKGYEEFVARVQEEFQANYVRGRVAEVHPQGDRLLVRGADTLLARQVEIEADLVVMATPALARPDAQALAREVSLQTDQYGFLTEAHPKLRPAETLTQGVFLAGGCVFPRDIPESVASGGAAAAKVVALLSRDYLESEPTVAVVEADLCAGCLTCMRVCAFQAIEEVQVEDPRTHEKRTVAQVNEGLCKGCGTCAAACPSGCVSLRGFTDEQLLAELDAVCVEG